MKAAFRYLTLPKEYCAGLGGLRWSSVDDTLVYPDWETFAFNAEVAQFLEGFASVRPPVHIGFIIHLLDLLRPFPHGKRQATLEVRRLAHAFREAGGSLRNAGVFFSVLCGDLPAAPGRVIADEICMVLRNPAVPIHWLVAGPENSPPVGEAPPLEPSAFEAMVLQDLATYSAAELKHWLRHGQGPLDRAGEELTRRLPEAPARSLPGILADLLQRPRLAGALPYMAQLVSALALPPRRLAPQQLPVGGYVDVTTHGQPDRILPSQFALDELDFFRRYAENELLYFRREEPPLPTKEEMVVLLDQGVRTWGSSRLVLAAAALALGKLAANRKTRFLLAGTSAHGVPLDPLTVESETLGALVEASDLSPHPAAALERVLDEPATDARDVVLLTHPRSLTEPEVCAAAGRLPPDSRLFAVTLDHQGTVDLTELRQGTPIKIRRFRVEYRPAGPAPAEPEATDAVVRPQLWHGDIEPIGFPFRFGSRHLIGGDLFDFNYEGTWLLVVGQNGMLHTWSVDGSTAEVLPRGMLEGQLVTDVRAVVGVLGGFVILGRTHRQVIIVHYDLVARKTTAYRPASDQDFQFLVYFPEHHCVAAGIDHSGRWVVDLGTREQTAGMRQSDSPGRTQRTLEVPSPASSRAQHVWHMGSSQEWEKSSLRHWTVLREPPRQGHTAIPSVYLDEAKSELILQGRLTSKSFIPLADGLPVLKGCRLVGAQCRGNTLGLKTQASDSKQTRSLRLFRRSDGRPLAEYPFVRARGGFVLSADGRRLALQVGQSQMEVRDADTNERLLLTPKKGSHANLMIRLGEHWLGVAAGNHAHLIQWDDELTFSYLQGHVVDLIDHFRHRTRDTSRWGERALPACVRYDANRFVTAAGLGVIVVADCYGQLAVFDHEQRLICMLFVFRSQVAAWMPDGTRTGPASLTGGRATPGATAKIAAALREAQ